MHVSIIGHALSLVGVQELKGKNISGVHMPYSADWLAYVVDKKPWLSQNQKSPENEEYETTWSIQPIHVRT